jgi:hypothetical protein
MHQKLSNIFEILERFLRLIRPRFYNRMTWFVVGAGLLLTATPWWGDLVNALAQQKLGVSVPVSTEHTTIGLVLVVAGLVYHLLTHSIHELVVSRRETAELNDRREHDRKIFGQLTVTAPEQQLLTVLHGIATLHQYRSSEGTLIDGVVYYLRAPSNEFLDSDTAAAAKELALALEKLRDFMSLKFFPAPSPPGADMRFWLFPEGNMDRSASNPSPEQSRCYAELSNQLDRYVRDAERGYANFRSTVKRGLAV